MILSISLLGDRRLLDNLHKMPIAVRALLYTKMQGLAQQLKERVKSKLDGVNLKKQTGRLYASINALVSEEGGRIEATVFSEGVDYARIQEEGGITPAHLIMPKDAAVLAFVNRQGQKQFAKAVNHPGSIIPAAHYLRDSYREMSVEISRAIKNSVVQGIRQEMRNGR